MPIKIIRQNITKIKCDAIVDPTDAYYSHGGGTDAAIHEAAGKALFEACLEKGQLSVGRAVIPPAFALPCRFVIHTQGPEWNGGDKGEEKALRSCYIECLRLAEENKCKSVAFPLISSGLYGYPKDRVLRVAVDVISAFLMSHEMLVYIVVFDKTAFSISEALFADVTSFIDDLCVEASLPLYDSIREEKGYRDHKSRTLRRRLAVPPPIASAEAEMVFSKEAPASLDDMLRDMDKSFAETLFGYIDAKGLSDVECYKRANVDKKTFSKIKCNPSYKPSKITAVSFAIALRLNLEETERLLKTVGMSLSRSNKFDVIIEYFITTGNYQTIFDVNETLYQFDQVTLG